MNVLKSLGLTFVLALGLTSLSAQDTKPTPVITLERTACFGTCPVYTVSIFGDGKVVYNGGDFVEVKGEQTSEIPAETVTQMVDAFATAGYFEWQDAYDAMTVTDMPTITTSVTRDGETHTVVRYAGDSSAPLLLPFLENWVDLMTNTALWTGVQPGIPTRFDDTRSPAATIQRGECFGKCPVYTAVLFDDGTVVYTGVANVDRIGVSVLQADPTVVTSLAEKAGIFGYFDWQDSYENRLMTDQPTTTTSFQTKDQYKQIVRYGGDMSAPIGLVRLEDEIDQVIASATAAQ